MDTNRSLPPEFVPPDLVEVTAAGFAQLDRVRKFVIPDLAALRQAAEANGTPIVIVPPTAATATSRACSRTKSHG